MRNIPFEGANHPRGTGEDPNWNRAAQVEAARESSVPDGTGGSATQWETQWVPSQEQLEALIGGGAVRLILTNPVLPAITLDVTAAPEKQAVTETPSVNEPPKENGTESGSDKETRRTGRSNTGSADSGNKQN